MGHGGKPWVSDVNDPNYVAGRKAVKRGKAAGPVFTKAFSRIFFVFFSGFCDFECNTISKWLNQGLASQKLCYI